MRPLSEAKESVPANELPEDPAWQTLCCMLRMCARVVSDCRACVVSGSWVHMCWMAALAKNSIEHAACVGAMLHSIGLWAQMRWTATIVVQGGRAALAREPRGTAAYAGQEYLAFLQRFEGQLPDMRAVVNLMDEPRVLVGPGSLEERWTPPPPPPPHTHTQREHCTSRMMLRAGQLSALAVEASSIQCIGVRLQERCIMLHMLTTTSGAQ